MAPQPKRRQSTRRQGKRRSSAKHNLTAIQPVECSHCHNPKLSHMACPSCGYYKGRKYHQAIA